MERNARSLADHWTWAADKGLMNGNTAAGLRSACTQVLQVMGDAWETIDITTLDVDDLLLRFQNLKKKDYTPQVLELYKKRFRKALASYLGYLESPGSWKAGTQERPATSQRSERSAARQQPTVQVAYNNRSTHGEVKLVRKAVGNLFTITLTMFFVCSGIISAIQMILTTARMY